MPLLPRLIIGTLLVLAGVLLVTVAVLGSRGRLPRNRWVGVRTPITLASEEAFALANRVAAVPLAAAGGVALVGGLVTLAGPVGAVSVVVVTVAVVGMLVLGAVGGMAGQRAVTGLPEPVEPAACEGVCAGCEFVVGCRGAVATSPTTPDHP